MLPRRVATATLVCVAFLWIARSAFSVAWVAGLPPGWSGGAIRLHTLTAVALATAQSVIVVLWAPALARVLVPSENGSRGPWVAAAFVVAGILVFVQASSEWAAWLLVPLSSTLGWTLAVLHPDPAVPAAAQALLGLLLAVAPSLWRRMRVRRATGRGAA